MRGLYFKYSLLGERPILHLSIYCMHLQGRLQNFEKRVLALACLSVCLSASNNSAPTGRFFTKFDIIFVKSVIFQVLLNFDKGYRVFYVNTYVHLYLVEFCVE
jgi:hypothetical protein